MADITFTKSGILRPDTLSTVQTNQLSGAALNAGQLIYFDGTTNTWKAVAATSVTASTATLWGFALNTTDAANQTLSVLTSGNMTCNGLTSGKIYVLGSAAGLVAPSADLDTNIATWYGVIAGFATSTTNLKVPAGGPFPSGVL